MEDLRTQLAAIRSGVSKSRPTDTSVESKSARPTPKGAGNHLAKPLGDQTANLLKKCFGRLPWFGRIENYDVARGFGFVSNGVGRLFLHAKGKLPPQAGKITENLSNRFVAYAIGSSERAAVAGELMVAPTELQPVIHALRESKIAVVGIHDDSSREDPRLVFVSFWGVGRPEGLAAGVRKALDQLPRGG